MPGPALPRPALPVLPNPGGGRIGRVLPRNPVVMGWMAPPAGIAMCHIGAIANQ